MTSEFTAMRRLQRVAEETKMSKLGQSRFEPDSQSSDKGERTIETQISTSRARATIIASKNLTSLVSYRPLANYKGSQATQGAVEAILQE